MSLILKRLARAGRHGCNESFIDAYTVTSGRVVIFWYGRKESARGYQCYTVKFPKSALYRYLRSGAEHVVWWGWVRRGDAEERGAGGVPRGTTAVEAERVTRR